MPIKKRTKQLDLTGDDTHAVVDECIDKLKDTIGNVTVAVMLVRDDEAYTVTKGEDWFKASEAIQSIARKARTTEPDQV